MYRNLSYKIQQCGNISYKISLYCPTHVGTMLLTQVLILVHYKKLLCFIKNLRYLEIVVSYLVWDMWVWGMPQEILKIWFLEIEFVVKINTVL